MQELKAWLQRQLGPPLFEKLSEGDIAALHLAGYDGELLGCASRESLLQLKLTLPVVDMLLAKCGTSLPSSLLSQGGLLDMPRVCGAAALAVSAALGPTYLSSSQHPHAPVCTRVRTFGSAAPVQRRRAAAFQPLHVCVPM